MEDVILRQDDGVVLTIEENWTYADCVDIDIEDDVEKLTLGPVGVDKINYRLRDVLKCFPHVKEIEIRENVGDIEISNFTFPNVRYVSSQNNRYFSHQALLRKYTDGTYLLNAFCLDEWEDLNIGPEHKKIFISEFALEGCRSEKIFESNILESSRPDSYFRGSSVMIRPCTDGVFLSGRYILWCDDSSILIFPPEVTKTLACEQYQDIYTENCVIQNIDQLRLLPDFIFNKLTILDDSIFDIRKSDFEDLFIENFCVPVNHPYYKSIDGVIYSKDGTKLILCPRGKYGHFNVPEGVFEIGERSFENSALDSISFPRSLSYIGNGAFYYSNIKNIEFGNGVKLIGYQAFSKCRYLEKIDIPRNVIEIEDSAFACCLSLKEIILNEGLLKIGTGAFSDCDNIKSLSIPQTVRRFEYDHMEQINEITFEGGTIPEGFLISAFSYSKKRMKEKCIIKIINKKGEMIVLPRVMNPQDLNFVKEQMFVDIFFEPNFVDRIPDMAANPDLREDLIIDQFENICLETYRKKYISDIRMNAKAICERLLKAGDENRLLALLKTGIVSRNILIKTLPKIPQDKVKLRAAILQASEEKLKIETLAL